MTKNPKQIPKRIFLLGISLLMPLLAATAIMLCYGSVKNYVNQNYQHPCETQGMIRSMFGSSYVLFRDLNEKITGQTLSYVDLFVEDLDRVVGAEVSDYYSSEEYASYKDLYDDYLREEWEGAFGFVAPYFDYYMEDLETHTAVSNMMGSEEPDKENYFYYLEFWFDENGALSVESAKSKNSSLLMKVATEYILTNKVNLSVWNPPHNCRMVFAMTQEMWNQFGMDNQYNYSAYQNLYDHYMDSEIQNILVITAMVVALLATLLPLSKLREKPFSKSRFYNLPAEVWAFGVIILLGPLPREFFFLIVRYVSGKNAENIANVLNCPDTAATLLAGAIHFVILYSYFLLVWYVGLVLRPLVEKGWKKYIKENSLIYRVFPFCKRKGKELYYGLEHMDVTKNVRRTILKIVLINGAVLFVISCLWYGGIMLTIVYSVCLYFGLKFYVSRMQKKYGILLEKIQAMADGNLNVELKEDLGIFEPFKEQIYTIQTGFRNAVEEEVKSQKMKSELITNVSHDLKTPLTAIITFVNLLKDENITPEQRREYLDTLEKKSLRLKVLIEDLFEISKATSGNVTMHYVDMDICNLVKQVQLELSDKLDEAGLDVRMELPAKKVVLSLDSQRTYRIYENLFMNVVKYSMPNTRVYVQGTVTENEVIISIKNISAAEIGRDVSALTERFVRGDVSRNTEGSGLGLAIVKSFVELQGGKFIVESDGDLFKAITSFPLKR